MIWSALRPTTSLPSAIPTVAAVAPCFEHMDSHSIAVVRFSGYGIPCEMMVLSSATTAAFLGGTCHSYLKINKEILAKKEREWI